MRMDYIFETEEKENEKSKSDNFLVLVIYDITDDKKRLKIAKILKSYGYRIQKSAFECNVNEKNFKVMKEDLLELVGFSDLLKIYKLNTMVEITTYGDCDIPDEDFLFF